MTNKEAISELKYAQAMAVFDPSTGEVGFRNEEDRKQYEAFGIAIQALETQPKWIPVSERLPIEELRKIKSYTDYLRNCGMGKKKCLEYMDKFIDGKIKEYVE